jgi:hypothetical protein
MISKVRKFIFHSIHGSQRSFFLGVMGPDEDTHNVSIL